MTDSLKRSAEKNNLDLLGDLGDMGDLDCQFSRNSTVFYQLLVGGAI